MLLISLQVTDYGKRYWVDTGIVLLILESCNARSVTGDIAYCMDYGTMNYVCPLIAALHPWRDSFGSDTV